MFREIDVPKFTNDVVVMGGLVLIPAEPFDVTRTPKLAPFIPAPALARSTIGSTERVAAFVRMRAGRPAVGSIEIVTTLTGSDGREAFSDRRRLNGAELAVPAGAGVSIPLKTTAPLAPGDSTLKVQAERAGKGLAWRELRFSITP